MSGPSKKLLEGKKYDKVCYGDLDGIRFVRTGTLAKGGQVLRLSHRTGVKPAV